MKLNETKRNETLNSKLKLQQGKKKKKKSRKKNPYL